MKDIIQEIESKASKYPAIYRGESECYPLISSSLYRVYKENLNSIITTGNFDFETLEKIIMAEYRDSIMGNSNKINPDLRLRILTEIQHYGGKTNFIDFSYSYFVAMFFAAAHSLDKDGRVIILKKNNINNIIHEPEKTNNRVVAQKSVFVMPKTGFIDKNIVDIVKIPAELKIPILRYLRKYHDVHTGTIYNDTIGFIQQQEMYIESWYCYLQGNSYFNGNEHTSTNPNKSLEMYNKALELNPLFDLAYIKRGIIFFQLEYFEKARQDFEMSTDIAPHFSYSYFGLSRIYYRQHNFKKAYEYSKQALETQKKEDLTNDIQQSLYKDIEKFHQKICHKVEKS